MRKKWLYELFNPKSIHDWESSSFVEEGNKLLEEAKEIELPQSISSSNITYLANVRTDEDSEDD